MYELWREVDVTGVSGTGIVAEGVQFGNGRCAQQWLGDHPSIVIWESIDDAMAIHGHNGATRVVWLDEY